MYELVNMVRRTENAEHRGQYLSFPRERLRTVKATQTEIIKIRYPCKNLGKVIGQMRFIMSTDINEYFLPLDIFSDLVT